MVRPKTLPLRTTRTPLLTIFGAALWLSGCGGANDEAPHRPRRRRPAPAR